MNEIDLRIQTILDLMDSEKNKKHIGDHFITDAIIDILLNYIEDISREWVNNNLKISEIDFKIKNILRIMNDKTYVVRMVNPDTTDAIDDMLKNYAKEISKEIVSNNMEVPNIYLKLSNIDAISSFNDGRLLDEEIFNNINNISILYLTSEATEFKKIHSARSRYLK